MKRVCVVVAVALASASTAAAQAPGLVQPDEIRVLGGKSENVATGLTVAGIAAPIGIMVLGATTDIDEGGLFGIGMVASLGGPAMGHWYSNKFGTVGIAARFAGLTSIVVGLSELDDAKRCARGEQVTDGCEQVSRGFGKSMIGLGAALYATSWVHDVVSSRREARRWNALRSVSIRPMSAKGGNTGRTIGVSLKWKF